MYLYNKSYICQIPGHDLSNESFCHLLADIKIFLEQNLSEQTEIKSLYFRRDYAELLTYLSADGEKYQLPDPRSQTDWIYEQAGIANWPTIYLSDITVHLMKGTTSTDTTSLQHRMLNDYKQGKSYKWVRKIPGEFSGHFNIPHAHRGVVGAPELCRWLVSGQPPWVPGH